MDLANGIFSQITSKIAFIVKNYSYINNKNNLFLINWDEIKFKVSSLTLVEFSDFILYIFKLKGFNVDTFYPFSEGKRFNLYKDCEDYILECRVFSRTDSLCKPLAMDLKEFMSHNNTSKGFIACTGKFTKECIDYCSITGIKLLSIDDIIFTLQHLDKNSLSLVLNYLNQEFYY